VDNNIVSNEIKDEEEKKFEVDKKYIALTFDDGPSKVNTPVLLDILKDNDVKVTFFVL
jgi:peptidoglycan/xylan/chitin deacetylase (PgdA/CDA1 family)